MEAKLWNNNLINFLWCVEKIEEKKLVVKDIWLNCVCVCVCGVIFYKSKLRRMFFDRSEELLLEGNLTDWNSRSNDQSLCLMAVEIFLSIFVLTSMEE